MQDGDLFPAQSGNGRDLRPVIETLDQCTYCGLCNPVCPTFQLTADERESPRGRIAMMRHLAERTLTGGRPSERAEIAATVGEHLDRCISCFACMPVCPEDVDYSAALDAVRGWLNHNGYLKRRSRIVELAGARFSDPTRLRRLLRAARWARPLNRLVPGFTREATDVLSDRAAQVQLWEGEFQGPGTARTQQDRKARVILLAGCVQKVLRPSITDSAIRLLGRRGIDVVVAPGADCCGAVSAQLGWASTAKAQAATNLTVWAKAAASEPVDYVVTTNAVCGDRVRRYAQLFRDLGPGNANIAGLIGEPLDLTELLGKVDIGPPVRWFSLRVGFLGSCALRASGVEDEYVADLLRRSGFTVRPMNRTYACCGGVGAYPVVEPQLATDIRSAIMSDVARSGIDLLAVHDVGCLSHLVNHVPAPVAHIAELLDWAHGGPPPPGLHALAKAATDVPKPRVLEGSGQTTDAV